MKTIQLSLLGLFCAFALQAGAAVTPEVRALQQEWAHIKYELPEAQRAAAFATLAKRAQHIASTQTGQAEPLIWHAIILASEAGEEGGLGALDLVKQSRDLLQQAEQIDPRALGGSVYTSLGSLYYQVPGWPISFGDDDLAQQYLEKALSVNPNGIDANFFYAGFLAEQGDKEAALVAYQKALKASPRVGRSVADAGRRTEIATQIASLQQELAAQ